MSLASAETQSNRARGLVIGNSRGAPSPLRLASHIPSYIATKPTQIGGYARAYCSMHRSNFVGWWAHNRRLATTPQASQDASPVVCIRYGRPQGSCARIRGSAEEGEFHEAS